MRARRFTLAIAAIGTVALVAAGCGGDDSSSSAGALKKVGDGEGSLNIVAWAGYAEDGSTDPKTDWVTPFEKQTGCNVNVKVGNTSDEMVSLMQSGQYDGVSASGDATLRLIAGGEVSPVNTDLVPNYADIAAFLKNQAYNSKGGKMYGIPHGWGANLLMYNPTVVKEKPTSWGAVFDTNSPYKGKITAYDSPIYIADAALFLSKTKPELGIRNPYALDSAQFQAAVDLLKAQKGLISSYWFAYTDEVASFESGTAVLGTAWQVNANTVNANGKVKVETVLPTEGATAWSDTWMISSKAKHPNCMYKWFDWITSPTVQSQVAQYFGEAPANLKACDLDDSMKAHCDAYKAKDDAFHQQLAYWTTPTKQCLDGRDVACVDYLGWKNAWTQIKG